MVENGKKASMFLIGALAAAVHEFLGAYVTERGRGYISDGEAWAHLRLYLERAGNGVKDAESLMKEMWTAIREGDEDAFAAYSHELERCAARQAQVWAELQAMATIAHTGDDIWLMAGAEDEDYADAEVS